MGIFFNSQEKEKSLTSDGKSCSPLKKAQLIVGKKVINVLTSL